MAIYAISDVHVKSDQTNSEILKKFINLDFVSGDKILFLGDIFDVLVGPHQQYEELYSWFFTRVKEIQGLGVEVFYIEGNHDFHIERLMERVGIKLIAAPFFIEHGEYRIMACHGDEIELNNPSYKIFRRFIRSKFMNFVANILMPYWFLKILAESSSKKSRKRNESRYGDPQANFEVRDRFRLTAYRAIQDTDANILICGHSHFKDNYQWGEKSLRYLNCGYVPITKTYIEIDKLIKMKTIFL
jgi:UDP-2,3-diacylglucosamine hydrolase